MMRSPIKSLWGQGSDCRGSPGTNCISVPLQGAPPAGGRGLGCEPWLDGVLWPARCFPGGNNPHGQSHLSSFHLILRFFFSSHLSTSWPQSGLLFPPNFNIYMTLMATTVLLRP